MARAPLWIVVALLIGYFFPAIGAFMLNPYGALTIALVILGLVASLGEEE